MSSSGEIDAADYVNTVQAADEIEETLISEREAELQRLLKGKEHECDELRVNSLFILGVTFIKDARR